MAFSRPKDFDSSAQDAIDSDLVPLPDTGDQTWEPEQVVADELDNGRSSRRLHWVTLILVVAVSLAGLWLHRASDQATPQPAPSATSPASTSPAPTAETSPSTDQDQAHQLTVNADGQVEVVSRSGPEPLGSIPMPALGQDEVGIYWARGESGFPLSIAGDRGRRDVQLGIRAACSDPTATLTLSFTENPRGKLKVACTGASMTWIGFHPMSPVISAPAGVSIAVVVFVLVL